MFVEVDGNPTGTVSCDSADAWSFVFDASTTEGKIYLSTLLSAYAAQKVVRLQSDNTCSVHAGVPTLYTIWLK